MFNSENKWPMPMYDENNQPHFLFIITPPFSGSTALAKILNTSCRTMFIQKKGEGHRLVPGLCEADRWNPDKEINYNSLKAVWLNAFQKVQQLTQTIDVVIEKSPPNLVRIEQIASQFNNYSFIANNRNPYANCASILYRKYDAENLNTEQRINILKVLAENWLIRSKEIMKLVVKLQIPLLTYEEFCKTPEIVISKLNLPNGVIETINPNATVKVKDYKVQKISNQNKRQIANLSEKEIESISHILEAHQEVLAFFNYKRYPID